MGQKTGVRVPNLPYWWPGCGKVSPSPAAIEDSGGALFKKVCEYKETSYRDLPRELLSMWEIGYGECISESQGLGKVTWRWSIVLRQEIL